MICQKANIEETSQLDKQDGTRWVWKKFQYVLVALSFIFLKWKNMVMLLILWLGLVFLINKIALNKKVIIKWISNHSIRREMLMSHVCWHFMKINSFFSVFTIMFKNKVEKYIHL